jgi:glycosyltransferase involved in cell wall biosynthesis
VSVSVLVPTRDRREALRRALRSVARQEAVDLELVLVDDGSEPPVDERAVPELAQFEGRTVRLRHARPRGVAAARNAGIEAANGDWLAFLDDDDIWAPEKLKAQLDAAARAPAAGWVSTGEAVVDARLELMRVSAPPSGDHLSTRLLACNLIPGGGSAVMARTELVRSLGGFDVQLSAFADWDMWIRLADAAPVATVPDPLVAYVVSPGSLAHDVQRSEQELEHIRRKYRDERDERGIEIADDAFLWYLGEHELRTGRRLASARRHLRLAWRYRSLSAVKVAVAGTLWGRLQAFRDHRHYVPEQSRAFVASWLAPFRVEPPHPP